jgi:16S rRNA (cytosine1402-N4)-methyltransferase
LPDSDYHVPVLINEAADYLLENQMISVSKIFVDGTLGGGGYTRYILENTSPDVKVIAFDRDKNAIEHCKIALKEHLRRVTFLNENFADIKDVLAQMNIETVSGLVLDLGLSSYQLNHESGFSYQSDTELDMRSDERLALKAKDVLNTYPMDELIRIFRDYGELKYYKQISRDIAEHRQNEGTFQTTFDLVELLSKKIPPRFLNSDMSKIFQALRIEVNGELDNLKKVLEDGSEILEDKGRFVCISYHSLEDRIVKYNFRFIKALKVITKKPVMSSDREITENVRARSAKLRAAEKISNA